MQMSVFDEGLDRLSRASLYSGVFLVRPELARKCLKPLSNFQTFIESFVDRLFLRCTTRKVR